MERSLKSLLDWEQNSTSNRMFEGKEEKKCKVLGRP